MSEVQSLNVTGMHPKLVALVGAATMLGWKAIQLKNGSINLVNYDSSVSFVVPRSSQINDKKRKQWTRKIGRYADPMKTVHAERHLDELMDRFGHDWDAAREEMTKYLEEELPPDEIEVEVEPEPEKKPKKKEKPTVVDARPWLAAKRPNAKGGQRYESDAVLQREWSDGHIDFVCRYEGCSYNSDNARSVATHYGQKHVRHGDAPPVSEDAVVPDPSYTEPMSHRYNPTDRLINILSTYLKDVDVSALSDEELARLFLVWAHERPDLERIEREPVELTDAQIIERIRMLVGNPLATELQATKESLERTQTELVRMARELGESKEKLETARNELADATEQAEQDRAELVEAVQRAEALEKRLGEWDTLRDLMDQMGKVKDDA